MIPTSCYDPSDADIAEEMELIEWQQKQQHMNKFIDLVLDTLDALPAWVVFAICVLIASWVQNMEAAGHW